MAGKKKIKRHMDLPENLTRTTGNKKENNDKFLKILSKLFNAVDLIRFADESMGSISISSDGALEISLDIGSTPFRGDYRDDGIVTIGAEREDDGYPYEDVISYLYNDGGSVVQDFEHWIEGDSIDNVNTYQYVYYKFTLLDEANDDGDRVETELMAEDDFPEKTEDEKTRYVVIGRTGEKGTFHQFHKGQIDINFSSGGGANLPLIMLKGESPSEEPGEFLADIIDNRIDRNVIKANVTAKDPQIRFGTLPTEGDDVTRFWRALEVPNLEGSNAVENADEDAVPAEGEEEVTLPVYYEFNAGVWI